MSAIADIGADPRLAGAEILLYPTAIGWDPGDDQAEKVRQRDAFFATTIDDLVNWVRTGHRPAAVPRVSARAGPRCR